MRLQVMLRTESNFSACGDLSHFRLAYYAANGTMGVLFM